MTEQHETAAFWWAMKQYYQDRSRRISSLQRAVQILHPDDRRHDFVLEDERCYYAHRYNRAWDRWLSICGTTEEVL